MCISTSPTLRPRRNQSCTTSPVIHGSHGSLGRPSSCRGRILARGAAFWIWDPRSGATTAEVLGFLLIGCAVGSLARFSVRRPLPIWMTIVVGAVGAFLGGWLLAEVFTPGNDGVPWIAANVAAAGLLVLVGLVRGAFSTQRPTA